METNQQRFNRALRETRKANIKVLQNVRKCCRSCINAETVGVESEDSPVAYTYGGQGQAYTWLNDVPVYRSNHRPVGKLYFSHDNGAADVLAQCLRDEGLNVEWNGSEYQCVTVVFK